MGAERPIGVAGRGESQAECQKVEGAAPGRIRVTTRMDDLADCDLIVESVKEDPDVKGELLRALGEAGDADLATTTSSLSVRELAERSDHADRVFGLHVFNPVQRMELVELCFPGELRAGVTERVRAWCEALSKTPVDVPDQPGFVVNRLLFPALFDDAGENRYRAPGRVEELIGEGKLGRKTGAGFYDYG